MEIDENVQLPGRLFSELVRWRAGWACEECGTVPEKRSHLHAHHKNGDHNDNRLSNGEAKCNVCHARVSFAGHGISSEQASAKIKERWADPESRAVLLAGIRAHHARRRDVEAQRG